MAHSNLNQAKKAKNDEFYTQYGDIQKEVLSYTEYNTEVFRGKTILLPCDDPEWSNFTKFFAQNFERFGLKKLISTSYAADSKNYQSDYQPTFFETNNPQYDEKITSSKGKIFTLTQDRTGDGKIDVDDLEWRYLEGDGDFRSEEIKALRTESDLVITNPPFSLFREFLAWIMEADKKFLIIGNINAISYKEVFPLIKKNKIWLGNGFQAGNAYFYTPFAKEYAEGVYNSETGLVKFRNVCWFSNLDHGRRHQFLPLMSEEHIIKFITKKPFDKYDNYDAIEVSLVKNIPRDYKGVMGVPVSFLDKYNPEQFEIIEMDRPLLYQLTGKVSRFRLSGKELYARIAIKNKKVGKGSV